MSLRSTSEPAHAFTNASTATITVVPAVPGRAIALHRLLITASAPTTITVQDSSGAALSQAFPHSSTKALILDTLDSNEPWWTTAAGRGVQIAQSGSANVGVDAWFLAGAYPAGVPGGGPVVPAQVLTPTTWSASDIIRMTLSGGNLTATTTVSNTGSVRAVQAQSTGKWYFEISGSISQTTDYIGGIVATASALPISVNVVNNATGIDGLQRLWVNNTNPLGTGALGTATVPLFVAADLGAKLIWFKLPGSAGWNGSGTADPAAGTGGVSIAALSGPFAPFSTVILGGDHVTANFGASAFSGIVPSGYTAGWGVMQ